MYFLFLAVLDLHCYAGFSLVVGSRGYFSVAVLSLLIVVASLVAERGLSGTQASVVRARGPLGWFPGSRAQAQ